MAANDRYTKAQTLAAIRGLRPGRRKGTGATISSVARRMACDWDTAKKYINRWDETRAAFAEARELLVDEAEDQLTRLIASGNERAIFYTLTTRGKHRGYSERVEHTGPEGEPLNVSIALVPVGRKVADGNSDG